MKNIYYIFLIFGFFCSFNSCNFWNSKKNVIELIKNKNLGFKLSEKPIKVFVALDTECPLSIKYTKKINELENRHKQNTEFLIFFPGPFYNQEEVDSFIINNNISITNNSFF